MLEGILINRKESSNHVSKWKNLTSETFWVTIYVQGVVEPYLKIYKNYYDKPRRYL